MLYALVKNVPDVTHIIITFIIWKGSTPSFNGSIAEWMGASQKDRDDFRSANPNIKIMASVGGAITGNLTDLITSHADAFATSLLNLLKNGNRGLQVDGIDLDLEDIPARDEDTTHTIKSYAVWIIKLSESLKQQNDNNFILSHAPQTPYFNSNPTSQNYKVTGTNMGIYTYIEKNTHSIDFYNIQYYNQGQYYLTSEAIFKHDDSGYGAAVNQLITTSKIRVYKIVVGKPIPSEDGDDNPLNLNPKMINIVNQCENRDWKNSGGIMVWAWIPTKQNTELAQIGPYFKNTPQ